MKKIKFLVALTSVIVGLLSGVMINSLAISTVYANEENQCGTCDTMSEPPGSFCNLVIPGGGCYSNTGAPCHANCGLDLGEG